MRPTNTTAPPSGTNPRSFGNGVGAGVGVWAKRVATTAATVTAMSGVDAAAGAGVGAALGVGEGSLVAVGIGAGLDVGVEVRAIWGLLE